MAIEKARSSFFDKERHQNERNNRYLHQPRTHGLAACIALLCERGQRPKLPKTIQLHFSTAYGIIAIDIPAPPTNMPSTLIR